MGFGHARDIVLIDPVTHPHTPILSILSIDVNNPLHPLMVSLSNHVSNPYRIDRSVRENNVSHTP